MTHTQTQAVIWLDEVYPIFRKWLLRHCETPSAFMLEDFKKWAHPHIEAGEFDEPAHPNYWGLLMLRAVEDALAIKVGYRPSVHASAHGRVTSEWRVA